METLAPARPLGTAPVSWQRDSQPRHPPPAQGQLDHRLVSPETESVDPTGGNQPQHPRDLSLRSLGRDPRKQRVTLRHVQSSRVMSPFRRYWQPLIADLVNQSNSVPDLFRGGRHCWEDQNCEDA